MYKDFRGIHAGWIKEIKRPILNLITGSKDYNIEKEDGPELSVTFNSEEISVKKGGYTWSTRNKIIGSVTTRG